MDALIVLVLLANGWFWTWLLLRYRKRHYRQVPQTQASGMDSLPIFRGRP